MDTVASRVPIDRKNEPETVLMKEEELILKKWIFYVANPVAYQANESHHSIH